MTVKNFKRDPMKTKTGKPRLGPLNIKQLDNLLETCRPKHRAKILRAIASRIKHGHKDEEVVVE